MILGKIIPTNTYFSEGLEPPASAGVYRAGKGTEAIQEMWNRDKVRPQNAELMQPSFMCGLFGEYTLWHVFYIASENGPVETVSFPINRMVIFHSYGNVYQRVATVNF